MQHKSLCGETWHTSGLLTFHLPCCAILRDLKLTISFTRGVPVTFCLVGRLQVRTAVSGGGAFGRVGGLSWPSGQGDGLEIHWGLPAQVRILPATLVLVL